MASNPPLRHADSAQTLRAKELLYVLNSLFACFFTPFSIDIPRMGDTHGGESGISYAIHIFLVGETFIGGNMQSRNRQRLSFRLLVLSATLCLSACGSPPVRTAFTELGTSSDSEYGAYGTRFIRSINATGLSAEEVIGTISLDPDKWSATEQAKRIFPLRTDLPDAMAPRVTLGDSFVAVRFLGKQIQQTSTDAVCKDMPDPASKVNVEMLTALRDSLNGAQFNIARWASLSAKLNVLNAVVQELKTLNTTSDADKMKSAKLIATVQSLYPEETSDTVNALESSRMGIAAQVDQLEKEWGKFKTGISTAGIVITNWERDVSGGRNATLADATTSGEGSKKISGFLILGDPQVHTLFIGKDFMEKVGAFKGMTATGLAKLGSGFADKRAYMTQYQLRARYLVFSESQHSAIHMRFAADVQKIAKTFANQLPTSVLAKMTETSAKIDGFYAAVTGVAESSVLDASNGRLCTKNLTDDSANLVNAASTIPVVSIRMSLGGYLAPSTQ